MKDALRLGIKKALVLAGGGAVAGLSAFLVFELARSVRDGVGVKPPLASSVAVGEPPAAATPSAARVDMRAMVREAIENARVASAAELDPFLAKLEAQARQRGEVLAVDIEPGLAKCLDFGEPEKGTRFAERMKALQHELSGTKPESPPTADRSRLDALFLDIRKSEGEKRQDLIREYLRAIQTLPDEEQMERHAKLNEVAGRRDERADPATLDALFQGIDRASDEEERQALIREYLTLVNGLPEDQVQARLAELNRRFGRPAQSPGRAEASPP